MQHSGVHHVSLNVADNTTAEKFYLDVLGFEKLPRPDFPMAGAWLRCGAQEVHLIEVADWKPPQGPHFALRVADIEAAREELTGRGVEVSPIFDIPNVGRQCFLRDPAGNQIELNQPNG